MSQPKKQVRTLHERLKIVEEVKKNPGEKRVDIAKRLGMAPSTLNFIFAKKDEIREQTEKCGDASKKRKIGKESTFAELHYTVAALQQVTQQTIENCFRKAGYVQGQSSGDSDVLLTNDDDDFCQDGKVQWHEQR
jgi:predicted transcriptional regulator